MDTIAHFASSGVQSLKNYSQTFQLGERQYF